MGRLLAWKQAASGRMPLILNGARQVGKTYLLTEFGSTYYENVAYFNFETNRTLCDLFNDDISPARLIEFLEGRAQTPIIAGKTLIIFDEIQSCERALTSLKYFRELAPDYHIACAGSLLGVAINREKYSFPVGNVETLILHPLDFEEFLWAMGREYLALEIRDAFESKTILPAPSHFDALDFYKRYLIIGGMPAAILGYLERKSFLPVADIQLQILNNYSSDMSKYASDTESVKIRAAFNSLPVQLAKDNRKFMYKYVQKGGTANSFGNAIDWLNFAGIVLKCQKIEQGLIPISVYRDLSSFKLYYSDVGLLMAQSGLPYETILSFFEIDNSFLGAVTENYIAQQLAAKEYPLFYWTSSNEAEVDFILQSGQQVIPVEVKTGERVRSKSLNIYLQKYKPEIMIRLSARNFGFENNLFSVPLYAAFCI